MSILYNPTAVMHLTDTLPDLKSTQAGGLSKAFALLVKQENFTIDYSIITPQAFSSQMGSIIEHVYERVLKTENVTCYRGDTVAGEIKELRKILDTNILEKEIAKLQKKYKFEKTWLQNVIKGQSLHLPDIFTITESTSGKPKIKAGEMKASGQNDSTSVPGNIAKLVKGAKNSAVDGWDTSQVDVEKSILIIATDKISEGKYKNSSTWVNSIQKSGLSDEIKVLCNEQAYNWLSEKHMSSETYQVEIINTTAKIALERVKRLQEKFNS